MKTVYLCGGINGLTDDQCSSWRDMTKKELSGLYEFRDPMRRDYRGKEDQCVDEIYNGDIADVALSDYILVNATRPSWGTAMEVVYARIFGKYIYCVSGGSKISPWLRWHSDAIFETWDMAIEHLKKITDSHLHATRKSISEIME